MHWPTSSCLMSGRQPDLPRDNDALDPGTTF
jgi:hypothetical protein